jgi:hypothetical protein
MGCYLLFVIGYWLIGLKAMRFMMSLLSNSNND